MLKFIKKIFVGIDPQEDKKMESAYRQQVGYLKELWNEKTYGVERIVRLFLCLVQFIYPTLFLRNIFSRIFSRKMAVEMYILLKLIFPVLVLITGLYRHTFVVILVIYLLSETIFHMLSVIFLSDVHSVTVSYWRSLLFVFLHYVEVVFDFSIIYLAFDLLNQKLYPVAAVYYSFVTNTTLGYGEYHPRGAAGQIVATCQLLVVVLFLVLFINYFSSVIKENKK